MALPRGATITNIFTVPIDFTEAEVLYVTYKQCGKTILEKELEDLTVTATQITVNMTQAEGLKFLENEPVKIQIRGRLADESAHVSKVVKTTVGELLKEGVI